MTRDEILAMKPGRELDALVAEKVMKEHIIVYSPDDPRIPIPCGNPENPDFDFVQVPIYSTDISAAWQVIEKIDDCLHLWGGFDRWTAFFSGFPNSISHGDTAPEAICKAALVAVMQDA